MPDVLENLSVCKALFGTRKVLGKEKKNTKENDSLMFGLIMENIKENKI